MIDSMIYVMAMAAMWYAGYIWGVHRAERNGRDHTKREMNRAFETLRIRMEHLRHQRGHGVGSLDDVEDSP